MVSGKSRSLFSIVSILLILTGIASAITIPSSTATQDPYYVPITVVERSGNDLVNYTIKIVLNSTNFDGWQYILYENGSDIYFTDEAGNPLYFWIEYFNKTEQRAVIWLKIQHLPAGDAVTVFMHYGGGNPYASYNDPEKVFLFYDDFNDLTKWSHFKGAEAYIENGWLVFDNVANSSYITPIKIDQPVILEAWVWDDILNNDADAFLCVYDINADKIWAIILNSNLIVQSIRMNTTSTHFELCNSSEDIGDFTEVEGLLYTIVENGKIRGGFNSSATGNIYVELADDTLTLDRITHIMIDVISGTPDTVKYDWIRVRSYVEPAPRIIYGFEQGYKGSFFVPVTVCERSGSNLTDYSVKIVLNESNFDGWNNFASAVGKDVYFLDDEGNPLYFWIESFDLSAKRAVIWVKVPQLPAGSEITIRMYFGDPYNPYSMYRNMSMVFVRVIDGLMLSFPLDEGEGTVAYDYSGNGYHGTIYGATWVDTGDPRLGYALYFDGNSYVEVDDTSNLLSGLDSATIVVWVKTDSRPGDYAHIAGWRGGNDFYILHLANSDNLEMRVNVEGSIRDLNPSFAGNYGKWTMITFTRNVSTVRAYFNVTEVASATDAPSGAWGSSETFRLGMHVGAYEFYYVGYIAWCRVYNRSLTLEEISDLYNYYPFEAPDNVEAHGRTLIRKLVVPEPAVSIGSIVRVVTGLRLPSSSLILVHDIAYSPNSTQFTHTFTAVNTSTAGYEINYTDVYGWRVYANPFDSTENKAILISEVNITLPYASVLAENLTLLAKTNGTGAFRQLRIRVLNSTGAVIAELTNATIGTSWTEVSLPINANVSGQVTIWINATVASTATAGEEIAVRDVMLFVEYSANPEVVVETLPPNVEYFNCSASFSVELSSSEYLNRTIIKFKLIEYLIYDTTDYPVEPIYIGNETIGGNTFRVYRIEPADYTGTYNIYALLENVFKTFRTHARGYDTETILVGEPLTIELPEIGNITILKLNLTYFNVSKVTLRFYSPGSYTIVVNKTLPALWRLGYGRKIISVKYGAFNASVFDVDDREVDYEDLVLQLVNKTDGSIVREVVGNRVFSLTDLWAGNYSIIVRFKDIIVASRDFELNITTDASVLNMTCSMKSLPVDYRGFNRSIVFVSDKQLIAVENLSTKYPYSRTRILLNGTGSFKLYVNYRGDLPTKVSVVGNVTNLKYYWDGNYLVITGTLGSIGELNITDLYKLRLELYDRLGNRLPLKPVILINGTSYTGSIVEDYFYPEDYVIELPEAVDGFDFYSFFDGFNETARAVTINHTDVTLKAWYRVPTSFSGIESYQITGMWWFFRRLEQGEIVKVYVEGYLLDYYGDPVPNRPVVVNVTNTETGYTRTYNVTTDSSGYFRTPEIEFVRGIKYEVKLYFAGDDIYVGSVSTEEIKPEELPPAPPTVGIPVEYYIIAIATALIIAGLVAAGVSALRHTIAEQKGKRFVKRK